MGVPRLRARGGGAGSNLAYRVYLSAFSSFFLLSLSCLFRRVLVCFITGLGHCVLGGHLTYLTELTGVAQCLSLLSTSPIKIITTTTPNILPPPLGFHFSSNFFLDFFDFFLLALGYLAQPRRSLLITTQVYNIHHARSLLSRKGKRETGTINRCIYIKLRVGMAAGGVFRRKGEPHHGTGEGVR